jgi:hypothetical protein
MKARSPRAASPLLCLLVLAPLLGDAPAFGQIPQASKSVTLTVHSASAAAGVAIEVAPKDLNGLSSGSTTFTRTYNAGTVVTLEAMETSGSQTFAYWTGCSVLTNTRICQVTLTANRIVTASFTAAAKGNVYYVSPSGSDNANGLSEETAFQTLQHAANLTQPGDTVYAMTGTYANDPCCYVLDISTAGNAANWIAYKAYPGQTPVISFNGWAGIGFEPSAAYVEVSGFHIVGNNSHVTIAEAQAQSTTNPNPAFNGNCVFADGRQGTAFMKPHHLKIMNSVIGECGGAGVGTAQSDYVTIAGNTIYNSAWYDIYGGSAISTWENWNSDNATGYKMYITGNTLYGNREYIPWAAAGAITDGEAIILDTLNNDDPNYKLTPYLGRSYIANNVIYNTGSSAIEVFDSQHADIVNNSTYGNVLTPVLSGRGELNVNKAGDVRAVNNIFYSNKGQNPVTVWGDCRGCELNYNIYYNGENNSTVSNGAEDLTVNPLYLAPTASNLPQVNLDVQTKSAAVGSGTSLLAPSTDIRGKPRPSGKGYDRGAYQQ